MQESTLLRLVKPTEASTSKDVVVLVHGLFATARSMQRAANLLAGAGYAPLLWSYPTFGRSIECHSQHLLNYLESLHSDPTIRRVNFLTHSLGGILVRYAIATGQLIKTQRLVMLAPPNSGSHLTRISLGPFRRLLPAIEQLSESPDSLPNRICDLRGVEVGVIAAASDAIVRVRNTVLRDQKAHAIVDSTHLKIPAAQSALQLALEFLAHGRFLQASIATNRTTQFGRRHAA